MPLKRMGWQLGRHATFNISRTGYSYEGKLRDDEKIARTLRLLAEEKLGSGFGKMFGWLEAQGIWVEP